MRRNHHPCPSNAINVAKTESLRTPHRSRTALGSLLNAKVAWPLAGSTNGAAHATCPGTLVLSMLLSGSNRKSAPPLTTVPPVPTHAKASSHLAPENAPAHPLPAYTTPPEHKGQAATLVPPPTCPTRVPLPQRSKKLRPLHSVLPNLEGQTRQQ